MAGITGLACVFAALAQAGSSVAPAVYASAADLSRLATELRFTEAGSRQWLAALGVTSKAAGGERLLLVSRSGEIVAAQDGDRTGVTFNEEIDLRLRAPRADLVLVHNHPRNSSFSMNDLVQLSKPGLIAIVAMAHDGSVYIAARTSRYDRDRFLERQYGIVRSQILKRLRHECWTGQMEQATADVNLPHLAALALARAEIITYRAVLSRAASESFDRASPTFSQLIAAAAGAVPRGPQP